MCVGGGDGAEKGAGVEKAGIEEADASRQEYSSENCPFRSRERGLGRGHGGRCRTETY